MAEGRNIAPESVVYKTLLESTKAIPWRIDWRLGEFTYIGPQIEELLGWPQASWRTVGDWADRIHEGDRDRVVAFCVQQSKAGADHEADYRALTACGDYVWIRDVVHVARDIDGEVEALVGFMFDITERKKIEGRLVELQQTLEAQVSERTQQLASALDSRWALEREVARVAEDERRRIGQELHDDLGQRLTGISLLAQALSNDLKQSSAGLSETAATIQFAASEAISKVRLLAHGLLPAGPDSAGLCEALGRLARESSGAGLTCDLKLDSKAELRNPLAAEHLFRIAQEAVSNAIRHSGATAISLVFGRENGRAFLSVIDNGVGGAQKALSSGSQAFGRGMRLMEHRASLINFRFDVVSLTGQGTTVVAIECHESGQTEPGEGL